MDLIYIQKTSESDEVKQLVKVHHPSNQESESVLLIIEDIKISSWHCQSVIRREKTERYFQLMNALLLHWLPTQRVPLDLENTSIPK